MKKSLLYLILLALIFISCSKEQRSNSKIFNINVNLGIESLEPVLASNAQAIWGLSQIMEGLVTFNKESKIIPAIAKDWTISDDGLTYTFNLKTNIFFHEDEAFKSSNGKGRKVVASDFKYCFERVCDPKTKTRGLWVFRDKVKGAQEYIDFLSNKSSKEVKEISGFKVLNDSTFQIELIKPFAPFLSILTMSYAYVYPREAVEFYGEKFGQHPIGTGPFKFKSWDLDKELILEKNPNYWDKDSQGNTLPYLDGVKFTFTQSSETEFLDFQNKKYDFHTPSSETYEQLVDENGKLIGAESKDFTLNKQPWLNTVYFIMLQNPDFPGGKNSPFVNNKKLRQALNYAIDKQKIVKYVLKNRGNPALNGPLPIGMPGFNSEVKGYSYDKEKTKQLLIEAGYPDGKGLDLTLVTANDEIQKSIAIAVQEQLKDVGVNIKLEQILQATLLTKQQDGEFTFTRGNWGADYYDPENFMALFYSKNIIPFGPNKTGYNNQKIDELYEQALRITDFEERKKIYNEMERIVIEDAVWLNLYYNEQVYLLQKNIEGFYIDGLNLINLKYTKKN